MIQEQFDTETQRPFFETKWGKRYFVLNDNPAVRLCAMLQAEAALSLPPGTRSTLDDGTLTLTSRFGDVEILPAPDSWSFRRAVKALHAKIDGR